MRRRDVSGQLMSHPSLSSLKGAQDLGLREEYLKGFGMRTIGVALRPLGCMGTTRRFCGSIQNALRN